MLDICSYLMSEARSLDERAQAAIDTEAGHDSIVSMLNLSAAHRMRALAAAQAAAPFCRPKLQAIEVSPATITTRSKFEERLARMSEDEVVEHLRAIANGATACLIEGDDEDC
jgi:hypothetical protein